MKRFFLFTALALTPTLTVAGCATSRTVGEQFDDGAITTKIEAKLGGDPDIRSFLVDVDTLDRVVTLTGEVDSERDKKEIEQIAYDTRGVERVVNRIKVVEDPEHEFFDGDDDAWITTKVKSAFAADPDIRAMNVNVDTEDGVVTLRGETSDEKAIEEAMRTAKETKGVKRVVNEMKVSGAEKKEQGEEGKILEGEQDSLFGTEEEQKEKDEAEKKSEQQRDQLEKQQDQQSEDMTESP